MRSAVMDGKDHIFDLILPATPMKPEYGQWSEWKNPDFNAKPGEKPMHAAGTSGYQIRYRVDYQ